MSILNTNYVLYNSNKIPKHLEDCISNIQKIDKNSNIFLISDTSTNYKNVNSTLFSEVVSERTKEIIELKIYNKTNYEKNPLWQASLIRIFILSDLAKKYDIKDIIHFDNDVLIYVESNKLLSLFENKKVNITRLNRDELVFGYSYFKNFKILEELCNQLYSILIKEINSKNWKSHPKNEMQLMQLVYNKNPKFFNILPSYPVKNSNYVFDAAAYGQILGGSHFRPRRYLPYRYYKIGNIDNRKRFLPRGGWLSESHEITPRFLSEKSKIKLKNNGPILINQNGSYEIVNLHIHSKELDKFKL